MGTLCCWSTAGHLRCNQGDREQKSTLVRVQGGAWRRAVSLHFSFGVNGFDTVDITLTNPVKGVQKVLTERFGNPISDLDLAGVAGPQKTTTWEVGKLEVSVQQTVFGTVDITFKQEVKSKTGIEEPDATLDEYPSLQAHCHRQGVQL